MRRTAISGVVLTDFTCAITALRWAGVNFSGSSTLHVALDRSVVRQFFQAAPRKPLQPPRLGQ